MDDLRDLGRQDLLPRALFGRRGVLRRYVRDLVERQEREELQQLRDGGVFRVDPELVELVGRRLGRIEPHCAVLGLAEFHARRGEKERVRAAEGLDAFLLADEFDARDDVSLLVVAAHLEAAVVRPAEMPEVVRLEQRVGELGEGDALLRVVEPRLDVFLRDQVVHREVLPRVAEELDESELPEPVVVVDHERGVLPAVEVEEVGELRLDGREVFGHLLERQQIALLALSRRVADQAGSGARDRDRPVPEALHPRQPHQRDQVSDVKAVGGRVEADVGRHHLRAVQRRQAVSVAAPVDVAALFQNLHCVLRHVVPLQ